MRLKAIAAIAVAGIMVMSVPMVAMAADVRLPITSSGYFIGPFDAGSYSVVSVNEDNKNVDISGDAKNNANVSDPTIEVNGKSTVIVSGDVTNNGTGGAIEATNGATVIAGSATNDGANATVYGDGNGSNSGTDKATYVKITGDVTNDGTGCAIKAEDGAVIVVEGTAKSNGTDATVIVEDDDSKVIAYKIENTADSNRRVKDTGGDNVYYIIKGINSTGINSVANTIDQTVLKKIYKTAQKDDVITVSVANGYELKAGEITVEKNADGTYSVKIPEGGGVTLEAIMKAVQSSGGGTFTYTPTILGSEESPITGGTWAINNGSWTYKYNGSNLVNTLAWIKTEKPDGTSITNRYYFDKNGNMATGWQKAGDKWFYFNSESGEMLTGNIVENGKIYHIDKERGWDKTKDVSSTQWYWNNGEPVKEEDEEEEIKCWYLNPDGSWEFR